MTADLFPRERHASKHTCHAAGCESDVPPRNLMCGKHWFMVPRTIRTWVWRTYQLGQETRSGPLPSVDWHRAADAAICAVACKEVKAHKCVKKGASS